MNRILDANELAEKKADDAFRRQAALTLLPIVATQGHDAAKTAVFTATIADNLTNVLRKMEGR